MNFAPAGGERTNLSLCTRNGLRLSLGDSGRVRIGLRLRLSLCLRVRQRLRLRLYLSLCLRLGLSRLLGVKVCVEAGGVVGCSTLDAASIRRGSSVRRCDGCGFIVGVLLGGGGACRLLLHK